MLIAMVISLFAACKNGSQAVNTNQNTAYACPMHSEVTGKMGDKCSKCGMDLTPAKMAATSAAHANAAMYACPMHPEMTGKMGDKCSKCGMDLMPVKGVATAAMLTGNPLSTVYDSYFNLKTALAKDDGKGAQSAAKSLFDGIANVPMDKLTLDQHSIWMKFQTKLSADAARIKGLDETVKQRKYFVALSENMHEVMQVIKTDQPVYYQNCPMYDGGKGANWLSLDSKINNPYYGKAMQTCGKTVETIK